MSGDAADARGWFRPVDGASLAFVRVGFGLILLWEVIRFFTNGWIAEYYVDPSFHFTYEGFGWIRPWPSWGMTLHFAVLGVAALGLAVGWRTQWCAGTFALGFSYVFLLEKGRYLNHFYLVILLAFVFAAVPSGAAYSWDAWRRGVHRQVPWWSVSLVRWLVGLVYVFAAIAKLNPDWLRGEPLRHWLAARADHPLFGDLLTHEAAPWLFSYGGILLDGLVVPLLLWRRTRALAFTAAALFHLTNSQLFGIGIFPSTMLVVTTIFFLPDWPRRWFPWFGRVQTVEPSPPSRGTRRRVVVAMVAFLGVQLLVPFRHVLYPGSVHWTEEGHCFSWHMKLRSKRGEVVFHVVDPATQQRLLVHPASELTDWQARKMAGRPDMILQYAHHLGRQAEVRGVRDPQVFAHTSVALNFHAPRPLIDSSVDLTEVRASWRPASWILPFDQGEDAAAGRELFPNPTTDPGRKD